MQWLNYHHLYYFWVVAREGGISRASPVLYLAPPTLSAQVRQLEEALGVKLFERVGRRLVLTEAGKVVYRFASEIFTLGRELVETVKGEPGGRPLRLVVGATDVLPKQLVRRLLEPAQKLPGRLRVVVREDPYDRLLGLLASEDVDIVLADAPVGPASRVRAFSHLLGTSGVEFFCSPTLEATLKGRFPACLDGAPMLLPTENTQLRRPLEQFFTRHHLHPDVVGEFEDCALMESYGEEGAGIFPGLSVLAEGLARRGVKAIGKAAGVTESIYGLVIERRIQNAGVLAVVEQARQALGAPKRARKRPPTE